MPGFGLEINGRSSTSFPHPTDDPEDKLRASFARMDGDRLFAFLLWELPAGQSFGDGRPLDPREFIQCAGSADALTVEVREEADDGSHVLSTLGRADDQGGRAEMAIQWRGNTKMVRRNEQWSSDDAADLFLTYWRTGALPRNISKRPVTLAAS